MHFMMKSFSKGIKISDGSRKHDAQGEEAPVKGISQKNARVKREMQKNSALIKGKREIVRYSCTRVICENA